MEGPAATDGSGPSRVVVILQTGASAAIVKAGAARVRAGGTLGARRGVAAIASARAAADSISPRTQARNVARATGTAVVLALGTTAIVPFTAIGAR